MPATTTASTIPTIMKGKATITPRLVTIVWATSLGMFYQFVLVLQLLNIEIYNHCHNIFQHLY